MSFTRHAYVNVETYLPMRMRTQPRYYKSSCLMYRLPGTQGCYCFAFDYETHEPIMISTWCSLDGCDECIPEWWFAI